ncbi:MFS transporter [Humibacter sp.]|uniref:MFS transporter n=1 Tax=Humibacter sp. TaxID=1940291 RepID=UPI003F7F99CA
MKSIRRLFRTPGVRRITLSQLTARLPFGMISLSVLIHVNQTTGSYGLGGVVLAFFSVGEAISGPIAGRLLGHWGVRPVLSWTMLICAGSIVGVALAPPVMWVLCALAGLAGLTVPPVMPAVRTLYPRLVETDLLHALFTLDTSSQEAIWIVGPVLATFLATGVGSAFALLLAAGILLTAGLWLISAPQLKSLRIAKSHVQFGRALFHGSVALSGLASFMLVASFCSLEVGVLARAGGTGSVAGVIIAGNALGSMLGGLLLGHRMSGRASVVFIMGWVLVFTAAAGVAPGTWALLIAVFLAGFGFAPAVATLYSYVSIALPESEAAEAFGWLSAASLTGAAAGTAIGGFAADVANAVGAFLVATAFAAFGVLIAAVAKGWYPALEVAQQPERLDG